MQQVHKCGQAAQLHHGRIMQAGKPFGFERAVHRGQPRFVVLDEAGGFGRWHGAEPGHPAGTQAEWAAIGNTIGNIAQRRVQFSPAFSVSLGERP